MGKHQECEVLRFSNGHKVSRIEYQELRGSGGALVGMKSGEMQRGYEWLLQWLLALLRDANEMTIFHINSSSSVR